MPQPWFTIAQKPVDVDNLPILGNASYLMVTLFSE
jgi:hypothetical protein